MRRLLVASLTAIGVICQNAADYKITSLPGIDITTLGFSQYAGHIELSKETNSNIFFWMLEQEQKTDPENLIIWLNGGPGCSSMDGLFLENGPFRVKKDLSLEINEGGWQNYATNVYVDQPVGTGFSFADTSSYMHNMTQITDEFVEFVDKLFTIFPKLRQQSLYIAGESFAGSYIPYFASRLLDLNKEKKQYNIKGIAIGNGWISPKHQNIMTGHFKQCQEDIEKEETIHISSCERVLTDITDSNTRENKEGKMVCMNVYDIRMKDEPYPECGLSWPYELSDVTSYLRLKEVKRAIHAEKQALGWKECTSLVSSALNEDKSPPADQLLPDILEEIPVLLYSGEYDLICNSLGIEYLIGNMTWSGSKGFKKGTIKETWEIEGKITGYYTQDRNLTYVIIKDGSHMVPYDKPIECLDMMNRFMGVGHGKVKGKHSKVGDSEQVDEIEQGKKTHEDTIQEDEKSHEDTDKANEEVNSEQDSNPEKWSMYYNWGTGALAIISLFALVLCCCWCTRRRKLSPTEEFGGAPRQEREGVRKPGIVASVMNLFKHKAIHGKKKDLRLGDQDETNELDELVVETPTIFEAEDSEEESHFNSQQLKQPTDGFTIADHDEDEESDFEDFADWEETPNSKRNKFH
ncbi:hypothetical protein G6F57_005748 [Rhizopus arrhizus]|uniref:Pheromone-processing carboxypeptidase KEX1 n=1 Tax=Rhizopus oryzae TaxID=64495 RepID=A0A9P6XBB3_RHIOR|nr:hypothetical protein G6F23_000780 [Rhizopus arrhizus]KAG1428531.1 hypothetical protein G6F58_000509 [Rhizopus delemar]KAG0764165.1 hypothetical protein G6F24_005434 [Rhizopus arrhizus]KAG0788787.1 hypothetical protein G6F21_006969 [Rhizopus arrhizus]KAG0800308.1 hypothetical protein G6F22_002362 [Rhizopus arrhizus]